MGFVNDRSERPWKTVDRDRDIVLYNVPINARTADEKFELRVGDEVFEFQARPVRTQEEGKKIDVSWVVYSFKSPSNQTVDEKSLRQIIKEALEGYGVFCDRKRVNKVDVRFDPKIHSVSVSLEN